MDIAVIGTGYVGLGTAAVLAELGNAVIGTDVDEAKIESLNQGIMPIYEPGLKELVDTGMKSGSLSFTTDNKKAIEHADVIFVCVGTPPKDNWETELSFVENVAKEIAQNMDSYKIIVHKSTVPVQTGMHIKKIVKEHIKEGVDFDVVSNPEFLREGTAIHDTFHPDRIVIGTESEKALSTMKEIYKDIKAPILATDIESAELIKHASNAFLATKISFINALAQICDKTGADVERVAEGMGHDKRIGRSFLYPGIGYGGFCFPKDVQAFIKIAEKLDYDFDILKATNNVNEKQIGYFLDKVRKQLGTVEGKKLGVLGLSFKPNTDDMRFAPSIPIITQLQKEGAEIVAYDPQGMGNAKSHLDVALGEDPYSVMKDADALLILTEWDDFKKVDLDKTKSLLKDPVVIDGRNIFDPDVMKEKGFTYSSVGRASVPN